MTCRKFGTRIYKNVYIGTSVSGFNETTVIYSAILFPQTVDWIVPVKKMEVYRLANIKSAKKRILVAEARTARNKSIRSAVKTAIKKVDAAVAANDKAAAQEALPKAVSAISKAASKGVYHKNTAARKVSRLNKAVNTLA